MAHTPLEKKAEDQSHTHTRKCHQTKEGKKAKKMKNKEFVFFGWNDKKLVSFKKRNDNSTKKVYIQHYVCIFSKKRISLNMQKAVVLCFFFVCFVFIQYRHSKKNEKRPD